MGGGGCKMWLGGNTVKRGMEEDMALLFACVCLIISGLFVWDDFTSHNSCSEDSQPCVVWFPFHLYPLHKIFFFPSSFLLLSSIAFTSPVLSFGVQPLAVVGKVTGAAMFPSVITC